MKKILAFDVSTNCCSVAISEGQNILAFLEDLRPNMQAERLIPIIEELLSKANLKYNDLDYISTLIGPGSFTGIRIGLASAKAISLSAGLTQIPVTNFELALYKAKEQIKNYKKIIIVINAYRSQVYLQEFDKKLNGQKPQLLDIEDAVTYIQKSAEDTVIAGSGVDVLYDHIRSMNITILPRFPRVRAIHLCRLADDLQMQGKTGILSPLYIRPPDAKLPSI